MKRISLVLAAVVLGALFVPSARADQATLQDPNDAEGPMDIRTISHGHKRVQLDEVGRYQHLLVHRFVTYEAWDDSEVDRSRIAFLFSEKNEWGRALMIRRDNSGALYGEMLGNHEKIVGYARVTRPDDSSLRVLFPKSLFPPGVSSYRWSVNIQPNLKAHPECIHDPSSDVVQNDCLDTAAFLRHDLN
jgi:hypothetical protein